MDCLQSMYNSKLKHYTYMQSCLHSDFISQWIQWKQYQLYHKYIGSISYYTFLISYMAKENRAHMKELCLQCTCCARHQKDKHILYRENSYNVPHVDDDEDDYRNDSCICFCPCRHLYRDILRSEEIEQCGSIQNHPKYPYIRYVERKREKWIQRYFSTELTNHSNTLRICYTDLNETFHNHRRDKSSDYYKQLYISCKKEVSYYKSRVDRLLIQTNAIYHYFLECDSIEYNIIDVDSDEDYEEMYDWSEDDNESYS